MTRKVVPVSVKATAAAYALDEQARRSINVTQVCEEAGVSRTAFYLWVKAVQERGLEGLEERSRRPHSSPQQIPAETEEAIVRLRKELSEEGLDHGATTIQWHLGRRGEIDRVPSVATVHRVLVRRGLVVPEPRKRPQRTLRRFVRSAPNELWQIDHTDWVIATGIVKIINIVDDHSRVAVRCQAVQDATSEAAWRTFCQGAQRWGLPAGVLSDNGLCFSGKCRQIEVFFEARLRDAGVRPITGRLYHPQTTGKVERFQQTLKRWLRRRRLARTLEELQTQLDEFVRIYNFERPHQGIDRCVPIDRWRATPPAGPASEPLTHPDWTSRNHTVIVDRGGRARVEAFRIHLGTEYAGQQALVVMDRHRANVFINDELVRHLELDHSRSYQPSGRPRGGRRGTALRS